MALNSSNVSLKIYTLVTTNMATKYHNCRKIVCWLVEVVLDSGLLFGSCAVAPPDIFTYGWPGGVTDNLGVGRQNQMLVTLVTSCIYTGKIVCDIAPNRILTGSLWELTDCQVAIYRSVAALHFPGWWREQQHAA